MNLQELGQEIEAWYWNVDERLSRNHIVNAVAYAFQNGEDYGQPKMVRVVRTCIYEELIRTTPATEWRRRGQRILDALDTYIIVRGIK